MAGQHKRLVSCGRSLATIVAMVLLILILFLNACSIGETETPILPLNAQKSETSSTQQADPWLSLMERAAYRYYTPLPVVEITAIDGTYVKFDPKVATPIPCRRCPDYMNEGGVWKLGFDRGTFRILHLATGWTGIGAYRVSGDRLTLFNDPKCPKEIGEYTWSLHNGKLVLVTVADHCAADLRSHNLEQMVWQDNLALEGGEVD